MQQVIPRAEERLYSWFEQHYPRVCAAYTIADLRRLRAQALIRWPELRHDLTELRLRMLHQVADETGYDDKMVADAYSVFYAARNEVQLYADVLPVLRRLSVTHTLIAMSNGNADLVQIGVAHLFDASFSARDLGVAKPDPGFFLRAAERLQLQPCEMLHVGDHPENDVAAAQASGLTAVWINRGGIDWPLTDSLPDYQVANLTALTELLYR